MGFLKVSPPTLVGLDIGSDRLKVVELLRSGRTYRLARMAALPSPPGAFRDGIPAAPDEVGAQIRALFDKAGIRASRVVVAAGGQSVTVREVRVPTMTAQELSAAVRYEAERYLPYNVQDVYMDFQVLGESTEDGRKMLDVIVVATRQDVVQRIAEAVSAARLEPVVVDVESFALLRSLMAPTADSKVQVFVDLGTETSDIVITEGERFRLHRNIPIGGGALVHAIQETLGVDQAAAKGLLEERGEILDEHVIPDDLTVQRIHDTIAPLVGDLVTEVRRSLDYFQTRARSAVVSQMVLTGGLARLRNLDRVMAAELGIPVEVGTPFLNLEVNPAAFASDVLTSMGPVMSVAVGLALRGGDER